jgi:hypothetical protein
MIEGPQSPRAEQGAEAPSAVEGREFQPCYLSHPFDCGLPCDQPSAYPERVEGLRMTCVNENLEIPAITTHPALP